MARPPRLVDLGKRAGVTSGLLGVLCVLAELCFLFPDLLVSREMRPVYHDNLQAFRSTLFATIVAALALGAFSAVVLRSKAYGLAGVGLALVAILMGGSSAEPIALGTRAFSAGLDYF